MQPITIVINLNLWQVWGLAVVVTVVYLAGLRWALFILERDRTQREDRLPKVQPPTPWLAPPTDFPSNIQPSAPWPRPDDDPMNRPPTKVQAVVFADDYSITVDEFRQMGFTMAVDGNGRIHKLVRDGVTLTVEQWAGMSHGARIS